MTTKIKLLIGFGSAAVVGVLLYVTREKWMALFKKEEKESRTGESETREPEDVVKDIPKPGQNISPRAESDTVDVVKDIPKPGQNISPRADGWES